LASGGCAAEEHPIESTSPLANKLLTPTLDTVAKRSKVYTLLSLLQMGLFGTAAL
jgi:hypothetical protein